MKIWLDDIRPAPEGYFHCRSVNDVKIAIFFYECNLSDETIILDLDYDLGDYHKDGGDVVKLLEWLEKEEIVNTGYSFHFHTADPIDAENMRRIIQKNGWMEIK